MAAERARVKQCRTRGVLLLELFIYAFLLVMLESVHKLRHHLRGMGFGKDDGGGVSDLR